MKCDDDSFVNVPNLIHFLLGGTIPVYLATLHHYNDRTVRTRSPINRLKYQKNLLVGSLFCHVKPISNYRSKWWVCHPKWGTWHLRCDFALFEIVAFRFTPRYMYSNTIYPNYLSGSGYVFTMDTAKKLYNASMDTELLYLEDVYTTGNVETLADHQANRKCIESYFHHFRSFSTRHLCCKGWHKANQSSPVQLFNVQGFVWSAWNDYNAWNQIKSNEISIWICFECRCYLSTATNIHQNSTI